MRASFFTPLCLTVGALQENYRSSYSYPGTVTLLAKELLPPYRSNVLSVVCAKPRIPASCA